MGGGLFPVYKSKKNSKSTKLNPTIFFHQSRLPTAVCRESWFNNEQNYAFVSRYVVLHCSDEVQPELM